MFLGQKKNNDEIIRTSLLFVGPHYNLNYISSKIIIINKLNKNLQSLRKNLVSYIYIFWTKWICRQYNVISLIFYYLKHVSKTTFLNQMNGKICHGFTESLTTKHVSARYDILLNILNNSLKGRLIDLG